MKFQFRRNKTHLSEYDKRIRRNDRLLLVLSGLMLGISFPPFPFPFSLLLFFGLIPYFFVIQKKETLAEISRATYLTFFVFSVITLYWVGSWQKEADPFLMISGGVLLFFNPILFLIPSTLLYLARRVFKTKSVIFLFPIFWITYEYMYMLTDLSFPWLTLGNGMATFIPFIQAADIVGAVGVSLIIVYINVFLYRALESYIKSKRLFVINLSAALAIILLVTGYGIYKLETYKINTKTIKVGLIQPNLDPWDKWDVNNLDGLTGIYMRLSKEAVDKGAKLIVWPETALPVFLTDGSYNSIVDSIYSFVRRNDVFLLTGMPDARFYFKGDKIPPDAKYSKLNGYYYTTYNGILLFSPYTSRLQRYGKMKLVPFGERVPFVDTFPFLGDLIKWGVGISGWNVGRDTTNFTFPYPLQGKNPAYRTNHDSISIDGLVCFESVFPYFVADFVQRGAQIITVVTNDSWYGRSSGPYQHKEISVLRAIENRRAVVRAANGGISCIIDPLGRTVTESKLFTSTIIVGSVPIESGETFFTRYPLIVPVFASMFSLWVFGIFLLKRIKDKFNL